ncbi:molybdopterin-binding protein [Iodobacter sp. CM08]|uniref:competence/damage-inducible protein A n=1 Tax=Iodobacter sp. CM08 TaxID=3085902 RepID=UPI002981A7F9|nr:molybdopterin-binding protein [Iodobacter sp. CM08]MDW5416694.1 molybdopterin-binding protein [Iodobacter sp. CM08]
MATFHLFIIGDEILSGRRQDKHFAHMLETLKARGHKIAAAYYLPDDADVLAEAFKRSLNAGYQVISCGGIGATPDDHTRQAFANALGLPLSLHPEAAERITSRFAEAAYPYRIQMAYFPEGCQLIPNPVNQVAGCYFKSHYLLPGFPSMAWPMLDWILDEHYIDASPETTLSFIMLNAREGELIGKMQSFTQRYPNIAFSSLPSYGNSQHPEPHIEFSITAEATLAVEAMAYLKECLHTVSNIKK